MHEAMAATLDVVVKKSNAIQQEARVNGNTMRPRWPMIVLKSPKGWTGVKMGGRLANRRHVPRASGARLSDPRGASRTS